MPYQNYFVEKRRKDKENLGALRKKLPDADEEKIVAFFSLQTGLTHKTIRQYVEELREAGVWGG